MDVTVWKQEGTGAVDFIYRDYYTKLTVGFINLGSPMNPLSSIAVVY